MGSQQLFAKDVVQRSLRKSSVGADFASGKNREQSRRSPVREDPFEAAIRSFGLQR